MGKLWVDDARAAPASWSRARNVVQAQAWLSAVEIDEVSLDHDFGPVKEGTGLDLVRWMIERRLVPSKVTIHSVNSAGAKAMADALNDAGFDCEVQPFSFQRLEDGV
jgi:hypothetical protein